MYKWNEPKIEALVDSAIANLEDVVGVKLTPEQRAIFAMGFGGGLTTYKNFPECNSDFVLDLWIKFKASTILNQQVKDWSDSFVEN